MSLPDKIELAVNAQYSSTSAKWTTVRDALQGETRIKAYNTRYLPMPSAMAKATAKTPMSWESSEVFAHDQHELQAYAAYKMRSRFPELTDATLRGIVGLILRNQSAYHNLPYNEIEESATPDDKTLAELELLINTEVMSLGRCGILAEPMEGSQPKIVVYKAEDILNWQTEGSDEDIKYTGVLLRDSSNVSNFWDPSTSDTYHLLLVLIDGVYTVGKYKNGELIEEVVPTYMGRTLNYIPFVIAGTTDLTPDVDSPPLWPLASLAVKIYQVTADLRNAQYMSCNPMLTISGIDKDQVPDAIGSTVALILEDPMAKAYYPKTDTTALEHVRMYMKDLQAEAIRLGANLLGNENTLAESGEAIRLRQSMAAATVASVVASCGKGLQRLLRFMADWMGKPINTEILVNKEFSSFQLTANEQIALVQSWQAGILSSETTLENFRRAGMLQEGEDPKAELERLAADTYRLKAQKDNIAASGKPDGGDGDTKGPDGGLPEGSQTNPAVS